LCGIAGYLDRKQTADGEQIRAAVKRMTDGLAHRGPDAAGLWASADKYCYLGHRRLSIIDLTAEANQPMHDASERYVISFNGEIYNYKELRAGLEARGIQFRTQSDTEVLLRAFIADGISVFEQADGMFAVAIYDALTKTLTLARDRAGEKPLYYIDAPGFFAFASELRPLLTVPDFSPSLSDDGLALYMALRYVPPPRTLIKDIHKLQAGSILEIKADGTRTHRRYFNFDVDDQAAAKPLDLDAYAEEVQSALEASLRARLNSDVPVGAFLSRGVDSSLICALLAKRLNRSVKTYTVGFADDPENEGPAARSIAQILGLEHAEYNFGTNDFDNICSQIGALLDEPNGDRSCVPTYLLSQFTREHVKVAISGDGGDELFAGYGRYLIFLAKNGSVIWPNAAAVPQRYFETSLPVFPWNAIRETLPQAFAAVTEYTGSFGPLFSHPNRSAINALRVLDFNSYMPGAVLTKVDRMSMRHGLEVRTPYLSPGLYALSRRGSLPAFVSGNTQKVVLRKLLARYLPAEHAAAPKKGFGMPKSVFLTNQERVRKELSACRDILERSAFFRARKGVGDAFIKWSGSNMNAAWATIVLARWIESIGFAV
jgi:asparagine synthase (glutamine-hydrolysing)